MNKQEEVSKVLKELANHISVTVLAYKVGKCYNTIMRWQNPKDSRLPDNANLFLLKHMLQEERRSNG